MHDSKGMMPVLTGEATKPVSRPTSVLKFLSAFWVPAVLVLAAIGVSGTVTALHTEEMSPIDEWVYLDYLNKFPSQGIVHRGEDIGLDALEQMACHGVKVYGPMGPPCGSNYEDRIREVPYLGQTSADLYTPVYIPRSISQ